MATINNPDLTVTTNRPVDRANVLVSCDIEFTEVEVNAMNMLGLEYTLTCQVLNKELLDEDPVITYRQITFPRLPGAANRYEHVAFDSDEARSLQEEWHARRIPAALEIEEAPFRDIGDPLLRYLREITADPDAVAVVVMPELIFRGWRRLLHNQRAIYIKRLLLFEPRVILVTVPYRLN